MNAVPKNLVRLRLARHGTTFDRGVQSYQIGARSDPGLAGWGREQAVDLASSLVREPFVPDLITHGPQRRQRETAAIVSAALAPAIPVIEISALGELDYGAWEGLTKEELLASRGEEYRAWTEEARWPDTFGDKLVERQRACGEWLETVRRSLPAGGRVVAVTSQGTLRVLYSVLDPEGWRSLIASRSVGARLAVKNGWRCDVDLDAEGTRVVSWNRPPASP